VDDSASTALDVDDTRAGRVPDDLGGAGSPGEAARGKGGVKAAWNTPRSLLPGLETGVPLYGHPFNTDPLPELAHVSAHVRAHIPRLQHAPTLAHDHTIPQHIRDAIDRGFQTVEGFAPQDDRQVLSKRVLVQPPKGPPAARAQARLPRRRVVPNAKP
jgi:hypothetical protein